MGWGAYIEELLAMTRGMEGKGFSITTTRMFKRLVEHNRNLNPNREITQVRADTWEDCHVEIIKFILTLEEIKDEKDNSRLISGLRAGEYSSRKRKELDLSLRSILVLEDLK